MKNKKDISIEILRAIACFIVILCHVQLPIINERGISKGVLLISCFIADGVSIFWIMMGCFLFNGSNFKHKIKKYMTTIAIPTIILSIIIPPIMPWILNEQNLLECIRDFSLDFYNLVKNILNLSIDRINGLQHTWYVISYFKILLWFPILNLFCNKENKKTRHYCMGLAIAFMVIDDIQTIWTSSLGKIATYTIIGNDILQVLIGYELYLNKDKIKNNVKLRWIGILLIIITNIIRYNLQYKLLQMDTSKINYLHSTNTFGTLCSLGWFIFILSFDIRKETIINKMILKISQNSFYVYLIHYPLIMRINSMGYTNEMEAKMKVLGFTGKCLYTITYGIIVLIISIFISIIIQFVVKNILKLIKRNIQLVKQKLNHGNIIAGFIE